MSFLFELKSYLQYAVKAKGRGGHGVHSPLLYELITQVLSPKKELYAFEKIEAERKRLLSNDKVILVEDFGAGSRSNQSNKRRINEIAKSALQPKRSAQALAQMVHHYQPKSILELGTSLGITTSYLASANTKALVHTIEGSKEIANQAKEVFDLLGINNARLTIGNIDKELSSVLQEMKQVDFVLMDGNHRYEPTMRYFELIKQYCHPDSILVLDDIHWSSEMNKAWKEISALPEVTVSVDFYHFGVLFFRQGRQKEDFVFWLP